MGSRRSALARGHCAAAPAPQPGPPTTGFSPWGRPRPRRNYFRTIFHVRRDPTNNGSHPQSNAKVNTKLSKVLYALASSSLFRETRARCWWRTSPRSRRLYRSLARRGQLRTPPSKTTLSTFSACVQRRPRPSQLRNADPRCQQLEPLGGSSAIRSCITSPLSRAVDLWLHWGLPRERMVLHNRLHAFSSSRGRGVKLVEPHDTAVSYRVCAPISVGCVTCHSGPPMATGPSPASSRRSVASSPRIRRPPTTLPSSSSVRT